MTTADEDTPAARPKNAVLDCAKVDAAFAPLRRPWQEGLAETVGAMLDAKAEAAAP
jgi:dTDP-4-dehydrorhamnose reductase